MIHQTSVAILTGEQKYFYLQRIDGKCNELQFLLNTSHSWIFHSRKLTWKCHPSMVFILTKVCLSIKVNAPGGRVLCIKPPVTCSDWSRMITWPGYWPLISREWSRDLDTGLWLVCYLLCQAPTQVLVGGRTLTPALISAGLRWSPLHPVLHKCSRWCRDFNQTFLLNGIYSIYSIGFIVVICLHVRESLHDSPNQKL